MVAVFQKVDQKGGIQGVNFNFFDRTEVGILQTYVVILQYYWAKLHCCFIRERHYCRGLLLQSQKYSVVFVFPQQRTFSVHIPGRIFHQIPFSHPRQQLKISFLLYQPISVQRFCARYSARNVLILSTFVFLNLAFHVQSILLLFDIITKAVLLAL